MSNRELRGLDFETRELTQGRLRSGTTMGSETSQAELEELKQQLETVQGQLDSKEQELGRERGKVIELEFPSA